MKTKDEYEDVPIAKWKQEKILSHKIAKILLPNQRVKIRFVKELDWKEYGRTEFEKKNGKFWRSPIKHILISEINFKGVNYKQTFVDTTIHELIHASEEVFFHPNFDPYSKEFEEWCNICGEPHIGDGHDRIWHDKFLESKKRVRKEKIIKIYLKGKK